MSRKNLLKLGSSTDPRCKTAPKRSHSQKSSGLRISKRSSTRSTRVYRVKMDLSLRRSAITLLAGMPTRMHLTRMIILGPQKRQTNMSRSRAVLSQNRPQIITQQNPTGSTRTASKSLTSRSALYELLTGSINLHQQGLRRFRVFLPSGSIWLKSLFLRPIQISGIVTMTPQQPRYQKMALSVLGLTLCIKLTTSGGKRKRKALSWTIQRQWTKLSQLAQ
mmetsp:Transcript_50037/g.74693  ORF Transcript_50037/g.74693 Transcript_50037/m.74693 type:complete len:220 (-) Transcript_50037:539-1198(-)